jgi:DNA-binding IclR family transcriptional regulator
MVQQEVDSGRYRLGPATLRLGNVYLDTLELRSRVAIWAESLARRTGCAVRTAVLLFDEWWSPTSRDPTELDKCQRWAS